jgi:hypothetical protein
MKIKNNLNIIWETTIPDSSFMKLHGRGAFFLHNKELILAYNECAHNQLFHKKGKLVKVSQHQVTEIFETKSYLWAPALNKEDIYLTTASVSSGDKYEKGILFKIDNRNSLSWQHQLDGEASSLPVVYQDSVFITDFLSERSRGSRKSGHIYRFRNNGDLLLKKPIYHFSTFEPWILKKKEQILLSFNKTKSLVVMDFKGNIVDEKIMTCVGFSQNNKGELFVAVNGYIASFDDDLNIKWEYKPSLGVVDIAPVSDSEGNLYSSITGYRLVSLDSRGKERWISAVSGQGYQPCVLDNGNILSVTSDASGKGYRFEQFVTYVEVFSNQGEKLLYYELPGYVFHTEIDEDNTIFIATTSVFVLKKEESEKRSIKIFSLRLS